jgi:hypothetical protein
VKVWKPCEYRGKKPIADESKRSRKRRFWIFSPLLYQLSYPAVMLKLAALGRPWESERRLLRPDSTTAKSRAPLHDATTLPEAIRQRQALII